MTEALFQVLLQIAREWRVATDGTVELRGRLTRDQQDAIGAALVQHIFPPNEAERGKAAHG